MFKDGLCLESMPHGHKGVVYHKNGYPVDLDKFFWLQRQKVPQKLQDFRMVIFNPDLVGGIPTICLAFFLQKLMAYELSSHQFTRRLQVLQKNRQGVFT